MTKTADYVIRIPNTRTKTYDLMGWILYSLHMAGFLLVLIVSSEKDQLKWAGFCITLSLIFFLVEYFTGKKNRQFNGLQQSLNFLPFIWIFRFHFTVLGVLAVILSVLYILSKKEFHVYISEEEVKLPSLFGSRHSWSEINNLVLKDGLLTVDFKNNKLFQQLTDENYPVDENEFNNYCRDRLAKG